MSRSRHRHERRSSRPGNWGSLLWSAVFTLGLFLLLPTLEFVSSSSADRLELHDVERVEPPLPPPPPPKPPATVPRAEPPPPPKPTLAQPRRMIPLNAVLTVDLALGDVGGDFSLDFGIVADDLIEQVENYIFDVSELDVQAQPIVRLSPVYPPRARARRLQGEVEIEFVVGVDGGVSAPEVVASRPTGVFDQAALQAISRWRFKPGIKDGRPVVARVRQKLSFVWRE